jgi:hypothetical protein
VKFVAPAVGLGFLDEGTCYEVAYFSLFEIEQMESMLI